MGRLLITLYLVSQGILDAPLLYLSAFLDKNKSFYYDNLTFVRTKNDLAQWVKFFLVGVLQTAEKGVETLDKIVKLKKAIEEKEIPLMGRRAKQGLTLLHQLFRQPVITTQDAEKMTDLSRKAANDLVNLFVEKKILIEKTGYQRNRIFIFDEYLRLFDD